MKRIGILLAVALLAAAGWQTAQAADQTFTIDLEIRQAISITVNRGSLNFGIAEEGSDLLTVNADNSGVHSAGVGADSAYFSVEGADGESASVSVAVTSALGTTNSVTLTDSTGGTIGPFVSGTPIDVFVGGSVQLDPLDGPGTYAGQGTLTVVYVP